jgi:hypothetical protein
VDPKARLLRGDIAAYSTIWQMIKLLKLCLELIMTRFKPQRASFSKPRSTL